MSSAAAAAEVFVSYPRRFTACGVRAICSLSPAPGRSKALAYRASHGPQATGSWNRWIQQHACQGPGDSLFDAFTPTTNATSFDGQHYYAEANLVLAQLLLNHIAGLVQGANSTA